MSRPPSLPLEWFNTSWFLSTPVPSNSSVSSLYFDNSSNTNAIRSTSINNDTSRACRNTTCGGYLYVLGLINNSLSLFLNVVLFLFIILRVKLRKTKSITFFLNLQVVHIAQSVAQLVKEARSSSKDIYFGFTTGLLIEMILALMITTVDRYVAISYPFTYENLTKKKVFIIISSSWIIPILFAIVPLTVEAKKTKHVIKAALITTILIIATVTLTLSNAAIYMIAKRHATEITGRRGMRMRKSTYVCLALVLSFVLLWLPYLIHNVMVWTGAHKPNKTNPFTKGVNQCALFNGVLDPILFVAFRRDVKNEFRCASQIMFQESPQEVDQSTDATITNTINVL